MDAKTDAQERASENAAANELLYRVVVASHMRQHASLAGRTFDECQEGFCGEWKKLMGRNAAT